MMKVARKPINISYMRELNSVKFKKYSNFDLQPLVESGFATFDGEYYEITPDGIAAIYAVTAQQPRPNPAD